jgi:hypothetical protein
MLLVIASFVYVCFDKVIGLLALMAVSRDHPSMDMVPLLNNLTSLNGGYSEKLMGLVGTFFTIVLAGNLFKSQQPNQPTDTVSGSVENSLPANKKSNERQSDGYNQSVPSSSSLSSPLPTVSSENSENKPLITKIPD